MLRLLLILAIVIAVNVVFNVSGAAAWSCEHFPWSKGCWGDETSWSVIR